MTGEGGEKLRRSDRLRSPRDYARLRRAGRRRAGAHFVAVVAPGRTGQTRLGLAVGRRVGGAVERNRVKRRVREWFRRSRCTLPAGVDLVIIARTGAADLPGPAVARELGRLLAC